MDKVSKMDLVKLKSFMPDLKESILSVMVMAVLVEWLCLKNSIMPFIILDKDKLFYMRGLKEYKNDKMFLIDTIKNEQDIYEKVCDELLDFNLEKSEKNE